MDNAMTSKRSLKVDIPRCISGEKIAWNTFVYANAGYIYTAVRKTLVLRGITVDAGDVYDIVQEVFMRLLKDDCRLLRSFDDSRASLRTWLSVVARSVAIDCLRKSGHLFVQYEDCLEELPSEEDPFGRRFHLPEGLLTPRQVKILQMLFEEGLDVKEAALALRIEPQTVRSIKHQAILKLREHMGKVA